MKEIFDIVDRSDNIIDRATREECHKNNKLIHRAINIILVNEKGDWLLQKRSVNKDINGGRWDLSATGHVNSGESYEDAAKRELKEELNLEGIKLNFISKRFFKDKIQSEFNANFIGNFNGSIKDIRFNKEEIDEIKFFTVKEIKDMLINNKEELVTWFDDFVEWFKEYLGG